jgi:hypothetical protein
MACSDMMSAPSFMKIRLVVPEYLLRGGSHKHGHNGTTNVSLFI